MNVFTEKVALGSAAVQLSAASAQPAAAGPDGFPLCHRIYVEPLNANGHTAYVGVSTVATSGTGVISELVKPGQVSQASPTHWCCQAGSSDNTIDLTQYWFLGTSGDFLKVTWFVL
jgi:hypothetical protein